MYERMHAVHPRGAGVVRPQVDVVVGDGAVAAAAGASNLRTIVIVSAALGVYALS